MKQTILLALLLLCTNAAFADISVIDGTTVHTSSATTITGTEPTGTTEDDVVLAIASINDQGGNWTDPADFTEIDQQHDGAFDTYVGYKVRASTAGSGYQFDYSGGADPIGVALCTLRGVDTSTPLDVTFVEANHHSTGIDDLTAASPAITTATNGAMVVLLQHFNGSATGVTSGAPAGYTFCENTVAHGRSFLIAYKSVATAGTETPGAWTTTGGTIQDAANFTLALKPATAAFAFSDGPNVAAATNGYTISGTLNDDATVYAVAVNPSATAPNCTQIKAGTDGDGNAAIAASEAWTDSAADSFLLTEAGSRPRNNIYVCADDGDETTDVDVTTNQNRSPDAGQTITVLE